MRHALYIQLIINVINIILDLYFVIGLHLNVQGAALATVCAEYMGLIAGALFVRVNLLNLIQKKYYTITFNFKKIKSLCYISINIFIRSLCLQATFFYFMIKGTSLGVSVIAANAVLMNFQLFTAYVLDGFANAAEALTGEAIGKHDFAGFIQVVKAVSFWSILFALLFTLFYAFFWPTLIGLLTNIEIVKSTCMQYMIWPVLLPIISVFNFLLDGIFIGATYSEPMRNSMIISTLGFFGCTMLFVPSLQNHGLWLAFMIFMILRAVTLGAYWPKLVLKIKKQSLKNHTEAGSRVTN